MLCLRNFQKIGFGIFFSVFFSAFFVSPSYAISDIDYTTTNGNMFILCAPSSWGSQYTSCDGYKYLIIEPSQPSSSLELSSSSSFNWFNSSLRLPFTSVMFEYNFTSNDYIRFGWNNYNAPVRFLLTDTLPSNCPVCPEPEEPEPCPVLPDNPYDDKLDNITQAIYVCAGTILVLYFFYCIYRLIIRNSGVS